MPALEGKTAIITGASTGIGRACALLFAREGAKVVLSARNEGALRELEVEITAQGGAVEILAGDLRDPGLGEALVQRAVSAFGGLDIAVNNGATMGELNVATEMTEANWRDVIEVNLTAPFLHAQHQARAMLERGGGSLIFVSSFVGYTVGMPGMAAYAAAKAGMIGLAKTMAAELGAQGIRVNALLPGGTDTPLGREFASTEEARAFVRGLHALKRQAAPEEIAQAALFLASNASSFVTGTALLADGGVSINRT